MMRITLIRHSIRDRGGDKVPQQYAEYLVQNGHKVIYWVNEVYVDMSSLDNHVELKKIPWPGKIGTILFTILTDFRSDIVLVDLAAMSLFAAFRNKNKVIFLAQDYDVSYYSSKLLQKLVAFIYWIIFRLLRIPVIVESEALSQKLSRYKPQKSIISPVGIDLKFYQRKDTLSPSQKKFSIILAVWPDYRKGIDIAEKALLELKRIRPDNDWDVLAIGNTLNPLEGISITNLGFLNATDLQKAFNRGDIYLMPSRSEGLSLLLLIALATQCCVVATEAANIVTDEKNGLISPVEDWAGLARNLDHALSDEQLRNKLQKNARILAEDYSLEKSCQKFEAALLQITNASQSSPRSS